jgi:glycosyltransferase involved in cell wall biosynthesis
MANPNPLITVVIPTYNHCHFLERALQSLLEQSYLYWEAIIIDNHSQDQTEEVVKKHNDPRFTLLKIHNNGVIGASRNKGIRAAKGSWIAFLDSDDWWAREKLQTCVANIGDMVDLIHHDLFVVGNLKSFMSSLGDKGRQLKKPVLTDLLMSGNLICNSSVVVRAELLNKVNGLDENPLMIGAEDFNLWLKLAELTDNFLYLPMNLGSYEFHDSGISRKDMSACYESATARFIHQLPEKQRKACQANVSYMKARYHFNHNKFDLSYKEAKKSIIYGKLSIQFKSLYIVILSVIRRLNFKVKYLLGSL